MVLFLVMVQVSGHNLGNISFFMAERLKTKELCHNLEATNLFYEHAMSWTYLNIPSSPETNSYPPWN